MLATDLDGTLLNENREVDPRDRQTLVELGAEGVLRVVATGRSLYSARRVLPLDLPLDYLVFSLGAGVAQWPDCEIVSSHALGAAQIARILSVLVAFEADFMLQGEAPDTHRFLYRQTPDGRQNPDFDRRLAAYAAFSSPLEVNAPPAVASQFVVIHPPAGGVAFFERLRAALGDFNVVRTTSPLDGKSVWIEIFPAHVSKATGCGWIAERHGVDASACVAVGNDYNDVDLLAWAGAAFVVANSPAELAARYQGVASHRDAGVSESVWRWREGRRR